MPNVSFLEVEAPDRLVLYATGQAFRAVLEYFQFQDSRKQ